MSLNYSFNVWYVFVTVFFFLNACQSKQKHSEMNVLYKYCIKLSHRI